MSSIGYGSELGGGAFFERDVLMRGGCDSKSDAESAELIRDFEAGRSSGTVGKTGKVGNVEVRRKASLRSLRSKELGEGGREFALDPMPDPLDDDRPVAVKPSLAKKLEAFGEFVACETGESGRDPALRSLRASHPLAVEIAEGKMAPAAMVDLRIPSSNLGRGTVGDVSAFLRDVFGVESRPKLAEFEAETFREARRWVRGSLWDKPKSQRNNVHTLVSRGQEQRH